MHADAVTPDHLTTALVRAAATARWPAGSLLMDVDETFIRQLLAPHLVQAVHELVAAAERHVNRALQRYVG